MCDLCWPHYWPLFQRHEPDAEMRRHCKLSFEGFARYVMDQDNYAFVGEHTKQTAEVGEQI